VGAYGLPVNPFEALPLLTKACDAGDISSCRNLLELYSNDEMLTPDPARFKATQVTMRQHFHRLGMPYDS
jgi:hypothetical protein